jgi:hypothetical protein
MILYQTIRSARAEKSTNPAARRMPRLALIALLTSALSLPSFAAWGVDHPQANNGTAITGYQIALPPIPYLESMPWIQWSTTGPVLKTDILIAPSVAPSGTLKSLQDRAAPVAPTIG